MRKTIVGAFLLFLVVALTPAITTGLSSSRVLTKSGRFQAPGTRASALTGAARYDWLLRSSKLQALTPAAKRAVLGSAGLIRQNAPAARFQAGLIPSSAAGTGTPLENVRVNNPALDVTNHTHNNSTVATDGKYIAISFDDDAGPTGGYAISSDGGRTFAQGAIPEPALGVNVGDGAVAFSPSGMLFYSSLVSLGTSFEPVVEVAVSSSTDHGTTFSTPAIVSASIGEPGPVQDAPSITVDQSAGSPFKGNVYVTWVNFGPNSISLARSTDDGATFQTPVTLPAPPTPPAGVYLNFTEGPTVAVGPSGELYVFYYASYDGGPGSQILVAKSTDGGQTFGASSVVASYFTQQNTPNPGFPSTVVTNVLGLEQGEPLYTGGQDGVASNSYPRAAVDRNGNVVVVFEAKSLTGLEGTDRSNIFFARSSDGGAKFSAPVQLNDDAGLTTQWRPSIAVTPGGVFGVKWLDRRNDPAHDSLNDVYMTISRDGGATFSKNFRVTDNNWLFGEVDPVYALNYDQAGLIDLGEYPSFSFHGGYDTMAALGETFLCSWSDERSGKSDIYFTSVPASFDSSAPDFSISPHQLYASVVAGASVDVEIDSASVKKFATPIVLTAAGVPGLSFSSNQLSAGQSAALTITASGSTTPGLYIVTISGSSPNAGSIIRKTNLSLTVFEPGHQAGPPVNATTGRGNALQCDQSMTVDSTGKLHLCFLSDTASPGVLQAYYVQSSDGGLTFNAPVAVGSSPVGSLGLSDKFRREARNERPGNLSALVSSSPMAGSSASGFAPTTFYSVLSTFSEPAIAVDLNGVIYISVIAVSSVNVGSLDEGVQSQILLYESTDGGKTFSAPTVAATDPCAGFVPIDILTYFKLIVAQAINTDKDGNLLIAYVPICGLPNQAGGQARVYVTRSTDGGASFSSTQKVSKKDLVDADAELPIRVAFNSKGAAYVLYASGVFKLKLAVASDGVHFTRAKPVYDASNPEAQVFIDTSASGPDLLIDANDNVFVSFIEVGDEGNDLYVTSSTDHGVSFSPPFKITNSHDITFSSPFTDSAGDIGYLYTRGTLGVFESRSSDGGKTFSQTENISGHLPSIIDHTEIAAGPRGSLFAYWGTTVGGGSNIYVCKFR